MPIEIYTGADDIYGIYPAIDRFFKFKVRAPNDVSLALFNNRLNNSHSSISVASSVTYKEADVAYEVSLGECNNSKSAIRKNVRLRKEKLKNVVQIETPEILNADELRGFWVSWCNDMIEVGRDGENGPFMSFLGSNLDGIYAIGIRTKFDSCGLWVIDENSNLKPTTDPNKLETNVPGCWRASANGNLPPGAMEGGIDFGGVKLYIARGRVDACLIPGKVNVSYRLGYIPFNGREKEISEYEILCGSSGSWVQVTNGEIPENALIAGKCKTHTPLYLGRANHRGTLHIGRVQMSSSSSKAVCYIPFGGREYAFHDFEIFVV